MRWWGWIGVLMLLLPGLQAQEPEKDAKNSVKLSLDGGDFKKEAGVTRKEVNALNRVFRQLESPLEKAEKTLRLLEQTASRASTQGLKKLEVQLKKARAEVDRFRQAEEKAERAMRFGALGRGISGGLGAVQDAPIGRQWLASSLLLSQDTSYLLGGPLGSR